MEKPVILPQQLPIEACDLLIITARHADAIGKRCAEIGIPAEKCLFLKNSTMLTDRNARCTCAKELLGETLLKKLLPERKRYRFDSFETLYKTLPLLQCGYTAADVDQAHPSDMEQYYSVEEQKQYGVVGEETQTTESFQAAHRNTAVDKVLLRMQPVRGL